MVYLTIVRSPLSVIQIYTLIFTFRDFFRDFFRAFFRDFFRDFAVYVIAGSFGVCQNDGDFHERQFCWRGKKIGVNFDPLPFSLVNI